MFNFDDLKNGHEGFPEKTILIETGKEQLKKGIPEEKVLSDSLEFVVAIVSGQHTQLINRINKQISEGINDLGRFKNWVNLTRVAEHAMESAIAGFDEIHFNDIHNFYELQLQILKSSIPEINRMFDKKWLKENYPSLVRD